jgi:MATE family multidrug resistance protein
VVLWTTILAVGVNLVLAYALIFGHWGAPELGVRGAAIASLAVQVVTALILGVYAGWLPALRHFHLFQRFWRPDLQAMRAVFRLGWPIGITGLMESGLFAATALMMGWVGTVELAAHGIAMEVTALSFMVHLGLSNAATVRAGRAEGAGDAQSLRDGAKVAIALSFGFGLSMVVLFLALPAPMIALFLNLENPESAAIIAFGIKLLVMAALFQMADAMQVMALGLLRAIRDTRVPMIAAAISYWGIGIPTAYVLGIQLGYGGEGLWFGLVIGLTCAATLLMWRFWHLAPRA